MSRPARVRDARGVVGGHALNEEAMKQLAFSKLILFAALIWTGALVDANRRVEAVWDRLSKANADSLALGTATFTFKIQPDGYVTDIKLISNTSNTMLAMVARRSIELTNFSPIPVAALAQLQKGYIEGNYDFTVYQPHR